MKSAVVTGANGFVGRAVVHQLKSAGINVISVVHANENLSKELKDTKIIICDMSNYTQLPSHFEKLHPDVFYHFSWKGTSGSLRADDRTQLLNVQGACDAVRAAKMIGCRRFVFASSIMEYEVCADINAMKNPGINAIYSTAKLSADYLSRIIAADCGIEYISAVISNIYGPGEKSQRIINTTIRNLIKGQHLSFSAGEQLYDFIYITDAADMFYEIGRRGVAGKTYYIGNRKVRPLKCFLEEMRDIVSPGTAIGLGELSYNGTGLTYEEFNKDLLYQDTGFEPRVSFADGIAYTRDWIEKDMNDHE